jgi:phage tail sheath protein FI
MLHPPSPAAEAAGAAAAAAPIAALPTAVTAFIGRTLKGPLNTPTAIASFADYQRQFGGLWQPAPLSYAVEQFFEHGGRQALIVRVANGARPSTLRLPAGRDALRLRALAPGTREYLRASVDYDGIPEGADDQFNLVLQRLRVADSEWIEEQEILRRVSIRPEAERAVDRVLSASRLMRAAAPLPQQRPECTAPARAGGVVGYQAASADGADGAELSDYDLIGDEAAGSGLFALRAGPRFELLCLPPLGREVDVGLAAWLVAARLCRDRQAMLIVDPPRGWDSPEAALAGAARWPFHSANALLFLPRIMATDRLRARKALFAPCGAIAGLLARSDAAGAQPEALASAAFLPARARPQFALYPSQRQELAQHGVNGFEDLRPSLAALRGARTLLPESSGSSEHCDLQTRRLTLWLQACILEGTSWTRLDSGGPQQWPRVRAQADAFLAAAAASGAFGDVREPERYFVICDERLNTAESVAQGCCRLLFGFAARGAHEYQSCLVTHERGGSSVRVVTSNRLAIEAARVAAEIESSILRQLVSAA